MIQVTFKCNTWGDLEALLRIASMARNGSHGEVIEENWYYMQPERKGGTV